MNENNLITFQRDHTYSEKSASGADTQAPSRRTRAEGATASQQFNFLAPPTLKCPTSWAPLFGRPVSIW